MPKIPVTAETLHTLGDGFAGKAVDAALADINRDVMERGHDGKKRTLTVTYTFVPSGSGRCEIDVKTKTTLPAYQPPKTVARVDMQAGGLVFNPDVSANPDQMTFGDQDNNEPERST